MMNILWIVTKCLDISVSRVSRIEMLKSLETLGHNMMLVTGFKKKKLWFGLDGKIKYIPLIKVKILNVFIFYLYLLFYVGYKIFNKRIDFVIADPGSFWAMAALAVLRKIKMLNAKFILDIRTVPVEVFGISGKIKEKLFNISILGAKYLFDGITVITPFMKKVLTDRYGLSKSNMSVWSSGASLDQFDPNQFNPEHIEALKEQLNLKDKFVIMYHGVLTATRGLPEAIKALSLLSNEHSDIAFFILGDGIAKVELENVTNRLELQNRVIIKDVVPYEEIPKYIALADVGILPFPPILWWRVSSPIKLMEYLAMGKPVIVTDIEAHKQVIGRNPCGFYVNSNKPESIARGIVEAYMKKGRLKEIGQQGRKLIQDKYSWAKQASQLEKYLKSIY